MFTCTILRSKNFLLSPILVGVRSLGEEPMKWSKKRDDALPALPARKVRAGNALYSRAEAHFLRELLLIWTFYRTRLQKVVPVFPKAG